MMPTSNAPVSDGKGESSSDYAQVVGPSGTIGIALLSNDYFAPDTAVAVY